MLQFEAWHRAADIKTADWNDTSRSLFALTASAGLERGLGSADFEARLGACLKVVGSCESEFH